MKNKKKRKMTLRQANLVKNLAKGMSHKKAAIKAGYSENCSNNSASQALRQIRQSWPEAIEELGLTPKAVMGEYVLPLMRAKETKVFNHNGNLIYSEPMTAWGPRRDGLDIFCKIAGAYVKEETPTGPVQVQVITNVTLPTREKNTSVNTLVSGNGHKPDSSE